MSSRNLKSKWQPHIITHNTCLNQLLLRLLGCASLLLGVETTNVKNMYPYSDFPCSVFWNTIDPNLTDIVLQIYLDHHLYAKILDGLYCQMYFSLFNTMYMYLLIIINFCQTLNIRSRTEYKKKNITPFHIMTDRVSCSTDRD